MHNGLDMIPIDSGPVFTLIDNKWLLYCDIITSLALMKHVFGPKAGGVCGTISSSIALYEKFGT